MKIIKPLTQSLLYKVFEADGKCYLCSSILSFFPFDGRSLLPEPDLWKFMPSQLGKDAMIDQCMPKPNGEVLVTGKCFSSSGNTNAGEACLTIGSINKKLYVFGNRYWKRNKLMQTTISDPEPFSEMAISWENAFGGPEYKNNPIGKGHKPQKQDDDSDIHPLPNVEYPDTLIGSVSDKPEPASLGPIDMTWPQRMKKVGTYDENWRKELFPGLARDIDHTFFNAAPEDQWIKGFFNGNEPFEIRGMHRQRRVLQAKLPSMKSRCFINQKTGAGVEFKEIPTNLDTVWLFPNAEKGIFIWRGVAQITTDDAEDILHMMVAYERLTDEPKTFTHYQNAFAKRIDEEKGFLYALNEKDLIPQGEKSSLAELMKGDHAENALTKNMNARAEKEKEKIEKKREEAIEKITKMAQKAGVDPATILPKPPASEMPLQIPEIDPENFDLEVIQEFMKKAEVDALQRQEKAKAEALAKKELAEKKIKEVCDKHGLDFKKLMDTVNGQKLKRPIFSANEALLKIKSVKATVEDAIKLFCEKTGTVFETIVAQSKSASTDKSFPVIEAAEKIKNINPDDPELVNKFKQAEQASKEIYRQTAHLQPKFQPLASGEALKLREQFIAKLKQKECFSGQDFAGADLHGLNLMNCNLKDIYLEGADLSGADLSGADLSGAVLAWSNMTGAKIHKAILHKTSLGGADCTRAEFVDADLTECVLAKSNQTETNFSGSILKDTDLMGATFSGAKLCGVKLPGAIFMESDLSGVDFSGADLGESIFIKPKLDNGNFSGTKLTGVNFIEASCTNALFTGADCTNARFLLKSNLKKTNFKQAKLDNANLMEADMTGASFEGASLASANLMKATCKGSEFTGVVAKKANCMKTDFEGATLTGANLMEANLKGARLVKSDLRKANIFSAELFRITLGKTKFDDANLKKTKIAAWRPDDQG